VENIYELAELAIVRVIEAHDPHDNDATEDRVDPRKMRMLRDAAAVLRELADDYGT